MTGFPERLKQLREERGLLQRELAEKFNLSRVTMTNYEQGNRFPEADLLVRLADFFNVSVDYLIGRVDQRERPISRIAQNLKDARIHSGMTVEELAMRMGVSPSEVEGYENGEKHPPFHLIGRAERILGVEFDDIIRFPSNLGQETPQSMQAFRTYKDALASISLDMLRFQSSIIETIRADLEEEDKSEEDIDHKLQSRRELETLLHDQLTKERKAVEDHIARWSMFQESEAVEAKAYALLSNIIDSHFPSLKDKLQAVELKYITRPDIPAELQNPVSSDLRATESTETCSPPPGLKLREQPRPSVLAQLTPHLQELYFEMLAMPQSPFGGHRKKGELTDEIVISLVKFYDQVKKNDEQLGRGPAQSKTDSDPEKEK